MFSLFKMHERTIVIYQKTLDRCLVELINAGKGSLAIQILNDLKSNLVEHGLVNPKGAENAESK